MARAARFSGRLDTVVFAGCIILAIVASTLPDRMRDPLASSLRRTIVAPLVGLQEGAEKWRSAWLESERKILQRDSLALVFSQAQALQVENAQLRKLLGLGSRLQHGFVPAEALHTSGRAEDVTTTITLTAGSRAGVAPFSPVVSWEGLVGMVQTVDPRMSIAILYSHPDFRVSAMSLDGRAFGIVYPHLDVRPGRLAERYLLELRSVPLRDTLKPGTPIVSSGLGGTWPRGVLIGTVMQDMSETGSFSRTYLIRPAVNPAHVTSIMVLTPQRASQGVGNVWADAARAQATARIVAAGDSLIRTSPDMAARRGSPEADRRASFGDSLRPRVDSLGDSLPPPRPRLLLTAADSLRDSLRRAALRARRDSIRRDSIRRDSIRRDTIPPETP